jgi:hypothetical protein
MTDCILSNTTAEHCRGELPVLCKCPAAAQPAVLDNPGHACIIQPARAHRADDCRLVSALEWLHIRIYVTYM